MIDWGLKKLRCGDNATPEFFFVDNMHAFYLTYTFLVVPLE